MSAAERKKSVEAAVHRITGQVFRTSLVPWAIYLNYTLFYHGMIPFGPVVDALDKIACVVSTIAFGSGIKYISVKNVEAHRFCMIVGTAGLFSIPFQRLYWYLAMKVLGSVEPFQGDIMNYFKTLDAAFVLAFLTVFGLAAIYTKDSPVATWSFQSTTTSSPSKVKAS